jgi:hypothetical protein
MGKHGTGHWSRQQRLAISAEGSMTAMAVPAPSPLEHHWELRLEEFEDGHSIRTFECIDCGAVRFE